MMLTPEQAVKVTGGQARNLHLFPARLRIATDTRTLQNADTFLALRGERFDGHNFVARAVELGAQAVIVEDESTLAPSIPALVVSDTRRAYMQLAAAARRNYTGPVIAITGSAGKTTTKHLLTQLLAAHFGADRVHASPANENNELGVSKLLLGTCAQHAVLVAEMGARHEGEIAELVSIAQPHIGILTNIGEAHLEIFGSKEALAQTKWGLFSQGAQAVLNAQDEESRTRAVSLSAPPLWFGLGEPQMPGVFIRDAHTLILTNGASPQKTAVDIRLPGRHNRANLAAALSAALLLGIPVSALAPVLPSLALPEGRYQTYAVAGKPRVIYDAYNANASGMLAALDTFAAEQAARRIAVLASMAELGNDARAMHERVGAHAATCGIDVLLVGGDFGDSIARGALAGGLPRERIVSFEDNTHAAAWLRAHAQPEDAVLLKGSRKYKMEEIIEDLLS